MIGHAVVTGCAGFIGSSLTERLLGDGVRVTGVDCFTDYYDATLKRRNQQWGLRELDEVTRTAALHGLQRRQIVRMPANNLTVVFSKTL